MRSVKSHERDLGKLLQLGEALYDRLVFEAYPFRRRGFRKREPERHKRMQDLVPINFSNSYQLWYSEAQVLINQLLPSRLGDFNRYYGGESKRKHIDPTTYGIRDYLQNTSIGEYGIYEVAMKRHKIAAVDSMRQQVLIVKSAAKRFNSQLFDIRTLLHADLLGGQLDAAKELARSGYLRAAGVLAGFSLEAHLKDVARSRNIKLKSKPNIADLSNALYSAGLMGAEVLSKTQYLSSLRNKCAHDKEADPTKDDLRDLIAGVERAIKNVST